MFAIRLRHAHNVSWERIETMTTAAAIYCLKQFQTFGTIHKWLYPAELARLDNDARAEANLPSLEDEAAAAQTLLAPATPPTTTMLAGVSLGPLSTPGVLPGATPSMPLAAQGTAFSPQALLHQQLLSQATAATAVGAPFALPTALPQPSVLAVPPTTSTAPPPAVQAPARRTPAARKS